MNRFCFPSNCSPPAQQWPSKACLGIECAAVVLQYDDAWQTSVKDFIYLPAKQAYARGASATNTDRIEAARGDSCGCWDTSLLPQDQWGARHLWHLCVLLAAPAEIGVPHHLCRRA